MPQARSRPAAALRWLAPALLLGIAGGLAPLWWEVTAPPHIVTARPWRDAQGALLVPAAAVRPAGAGAREIVASGEGVVFVLERGVVRVTRVRLGAVSHDVVEIAGGLAEQVLIAANPPRGLEDRHRVAAASLDAPSR